ncbi:EF-hand domain-containing family member C2-like [Scylla paramamosain]|uniref:EF-hand domain-containing family member C2-like n=1 Tax=Scylla paramamosain TaxID=85552 RepID=UPI00308307BA
MREVMVASSRQVGECVTLLGRRYLVTGCDSATRTYLSSLGLAPTPDLLPYSTTFILPTQAGTDTRAAKLPFSLEWPKKHPLATFVQHSTQVLRFFGEWAAEGEDVGGVTTPVTDKVELRYYLEDDTAEVRVHHLTPHQHALTPTPPAVPTKLLKRAPIPKNLSEVAGAVSLGAIGRPTLNLLGLRGGRVHLKDRRPQAASSPQFLGPEDLILGQTVRVCGRLLRLCECDAFTTRYYKQALGVDQVPAEYQYLSRKIGTAPAPRKSPLDPRRLEEHPRDTLHPLPTTVTTLVGGYHARDIRDGCEDKILRFGAHLVSDDERDRNRDFVVNFYIYDSTISVFELPKLNSGRRAGMFLGRGLVVAPEGGHVGVDHLYMGATLSLNSHVFRLTHADEFTLRYMEEHADEFTQASYNVALDEARRCLGHHDLTAILHRLAESDPSKTGFVSSFLVISSLAKALSGSKLSEQQVVSLVRRHRRLNATPLTGQDLAHLTALHLKRHNYYGVPEMAVGLRGRDVDSKGRLPAASVRAALQAARLPVSSTLLDALVNSVTQKDGLVDYEQLCRELDWSLRPNLHDNLPCQLDESSLETALRRARDETDYVTLIADLEGSAATHHFAGTGLV